MYDDDDDDDWLTPANQQTSLNTHQSNIPDFNTTASDVTVPFTSPQLSPHDVTLTADMTARSPATVSVAMAAKQAAIKRRRRILSKRLAIAKQLRSEGTSVDAHSQPTAPSAEIGPKAAQLGGFQSSTIGGRRIAMGTQALLRHNKRKSCELLTTPEKQRQNVTAPSNAAKRRSLGAGFFRGNTDDDDGDARFQHHDTPTKASARFTPLRHSYIPTLKHINEQVSSNV